jgi:hypothetical protein
MKDVTGIPLLLSLGLSAMNETSAKLSAEQKSVLGATLLSTLDAISIPSPSKVDDVSQVAHLSTRYLEKLYALLQKFLENCPPSSDTLSTTLTSLAANCIPFLDFDDVKIPSLAWNALALIMRIDFDVILINIMQHLYPKLNRATSDFLSAFVSSKFKMREGEEFLKMWTNLLWNENPGNTCDSALRRPDLINTYDRG